MQYLNKVIMNSRIITLICFSFLSIQIFAQVEGIVINKEINTPIPYANIWIANKDIGTTSDTDGSFHLKDTLNIDTIVVTAIGYEKTYFQIDSSYVVVALEPKTYQIPEVRVTPGSNDEIVVGRFKRSQIHSVVCPGRPQIYARFFQFKEEYGTNATIKSIKFPTLSMTKAKINLRIFNVNARGEPGDDILSYNYLITINKGKNMNRVELPYETNTFFPEKGIFIAFEFLIIKENEYLPPRYKDLTGKIVKNKGDLIGYMPAMGLQRSASPVNYWIYDKGKWLKNSLKEKSIYEDLAIELTLSH